MLLVYAAHWGPMLSQRRNHTAASIRLCAGHSTCTRTAGSCTACGRCRASGRKKFFSVGLFALALMNPYGSCNIDSGSTYVNFSCKRGSSRSLAYQTKPRAHLRRIGTRRALCTLWPDKWVLFYRLEAAETKESLFHKYQT